MKTSISFLLSALLGILVWHTPLAMGQESQGQFEGMVYRVASEDGSYCHLKFPPMSDESLSWARPEFKNAAAAIDFYGPCNYDPLGKDEVIAQRRIMHQAIAGDGD